MPHLYQYELKYKYTYILIAHKNDPSTHDHHNDIRISVMMGGHNRDSKPMSTLTATHNTQDMSQWMTSGASRLRAKQNRTFASRAQQRAAAASSAVSYTYTHSTSRMSGGQQQGGRRIRMAGTFILERE